MEDSNDSLHSDFPGSAVIHEEGKDSDVIHVFGEFAYANCAEIESALVRTVRIGRRTICSLHGCTYLDAAGIGVLKRARLALGESFSIEAPEHGLVRRVLDLCRVTTTCDEAA